VKVQEHREAPVAPWWAWVTLNLPTFTNSWRKTLGFLSSHTRGASVEVCWSPGDFPGRGRLRVFHTVMWKGRGRHRKERDFSPPRVLGSLSWGGGRDISRRELFQN
jgi:hypothetical protein